MHDDIHHTLGEHGARIGRIEADVREMKGDVRAIRDTLTQAKGGWKLIALVVAISGAVGAVIAKISAAGAFFR